MSRSCSLWLALVAAALVIWGGTAGADSEKKEPAAAILTPKEAAKVSQTEEVEGQMNVEGWPVVLVRPGIPDQPWWVQAPVEEVTKGRFTAQVQIGDAMTEKGTRFRIIVVIAPNKEEAQKFKRGTTRTSLPAGLQRSDPVNVVRE